jgi:hypothetical protein
MSLRPNPSHNEAQRLRDVKNAAQDGKQLELHNQIQAVKVFAKAAHFKEKA